MWLFTQTGFVSAVEHFSDKNIIVARARDKESLKELAALAKGDIVNTPSNDYPWRVHVSRTIFTEWMLQQISSLQYSNFKDRVHVTRGDKYHTVLGKVWYTMHGIEERY